MFPLFCVMIIPILSSLPLQAEKLTKHSVPIVVFPQDKRLMYGGRWRFTDIHSSPTMRADWTCSDLSFSVQLRSESPSKLPIVWYGERVRVNITVYDETQPRRLLFFQIFTGPSIDDPLVNPEEARSVGWIEFPHLPGNSSHNLTVHLTKLTTASPFGTGVGLEVFRPSILRFYGIGKSTGGDIEVVESTFSWRRRIVSIGGSDTAGYCVDGTPQIKGIDLILNGWKYVNCKFAYASVLGDMLEAHVDVQGISGVGLMQNAKAKEKWQMGKIAMPGFFNRTLQTQKDEMWNFKSHTSPDLVTISLGGNDYNHQEGHVPSNSSFSDHYGKFLSFLFEVYDPKTIFVGVCGMGSPNEVKFDPDNNRCRPCPHVEDAVVEFKKVHLELSSRLFYIFIPCDGSVVKGQTDIGCDGHKNRIGQNEVAKCLAPKIKKIMNWK